MSANPHRDFIAERNHAVPLVSVPIKPSTQKPALATPECGSGWYHDVAIQESQQAPARKH